MTTIGAAWFKTKDVENADSEYYYSISFDEAIMPFQIDKNKKFIMKPNKSKGDNEKAPDFFIEAYIPKADSTSGK